MNTRHIKKRRGVVWQSQDCIANESKKFKKTGSSDAELQTVNEEQSYPNGNKDRNLFSLFFLFIFL